MMSLDDLHLDTPALLDGLYLSDRAAVLRQLEQLAQRGWEEAVRSGMVRHVRRSIFRCRIEGATVKITLLLFAYVPPGMFRANRVVVVDRVVSPLRERWPWKWTLDTGHAESRRQRILKGP
jgi:hypothetical protein